MRFDGVALSTPFAIEFKLNPGALSMSEPCLSIPNIAKRYGVGRATVWRSVKSGRLPAFRIGTLYRIRPSNITPEIVDSWKNPPQRRWAGLPTGPLVYFLMGVSGYVKIGFTACLAERMKDLQVGCPVPLRLVAHIEGRLHLEREYHARFAGHRCEGEWFHLTPEIEAEIARLNTEGQTQ